MGSSKVCSRAGPSYWTTFDSNVQASAVPRYWSPLANQHLVARQATAVHLNWIPFAVQLFVQMQVRWIGLQPLFVMIRPLEFLRTGTDLNCFLRKVSRVGLQLSTQVLRRLQFL